MLSRIAVRNAQMKLVHNDLPTAIGFFFGQYPAKA